MNYSNNCKVIRFCRLGTELLGFLLLIQISVINITKLSTSSADVSSNAKSPAICAGASDKCRATQQFVAFQACWKLQSIAIIFFASHQWPEAGEHTRTIITWYVFDPARCTFGRETNILWHASPGTLVSKNESFLGAICGIFCSRLSSRVVVLNVVTIGALATRPTMCNGLVGCKRLLTIFKCGIHAWSTVKSANRIEIKVGQGWTGLAQVRSLDRYPVCPYSSKQRCDTGSASYPHQPAAPNRRTSITILA